MIIREAHEADAQGIADVHVNSWRTTYKGILPEALLASLSYDRREGMWRRTITNHRSHIFVAEDTRGRIIGFASGGKAQENPAQCDAELYAIYLLKEFQGQGIGRKLVRALAKKLEAEALTSLILWVLPENPACRFYEALGGAKGTERLLELEGAQVTEIAYVWSALRDLI